VSNIIGYARVSTREQSAEAQEAELSAYGAARVFKRTNSWHNRGFRKLAICTEVRTRVIDAFIALAAAIIITRRLIREAWTRYRWNERPTRQP
jgi:DNA invertase Pin-like site-specific DNA recombinase